MRFIKDILWLLFSNSAKIVGIGGETGSAATLAGDGELKFWLVGRPEVLSFPGATRLGAEIKHTGMGDVSVRGEVVETEGTGFTTAVGDPAEAWSTRNFPLITWLATTELLRDDWAAEPLTPCETFLFVPADGLAMIHTLVLTTDM